mmetsp:Transcript_2141/g.14083  ORF Transcript_2141/g.14083 Transcript_2141/m.14083 type:complete len:162 (+) Transcript_2141:1269-1754(+)
MGISLQRAHPYDRQVFLWSVYSNCKKLFRNPHWTTMAHNMDLLEGPKLVQFLLMVHKAHISSIPPPIARLWKFSALPNNCSNISTWRKRTYLLKCPCNPCSLPHVSGRRDAPVHTQAISIAVSHAIASRRRRGHKRAARQVDLSSSKELGGRDFHVIRAGS